MEQIEKRGMDCSCQEYFGHSCAAVSFWLKYMYGTINYNRVPGNVSPKEIAAAFPEYPTRGALEEYLSDLVAPDFPCELQKARRPPCPATGC